MKCLILSWYYGVGEGQIESSMDVVNPPITHVAMPT